MDENHFDEIRRRLIANGAIADSGEASDKTNRSTTEPHEPQPPKNISETLPENLETFSLETMDPKLRRSLIRYLNRDGIPTLENDQSIAFSFSELRQRLNLVDTKILRKAAAQFPKFFTTQEKKQNAFSSGMMSRQITFVKIVNARQLLKILEHLAKKSLEN
jgi:hypothetical protein